MNDPMSIYELDKAVARYEAYGDRRDAKKATELALQLAQSEHTFEGMQRLLMAIVGQVNEQFDRETALAVKATCSGAWDGINGWLM